MQTEFRQRLKQLFAGAVLLSHGERVRFLIERCDDSAMRAELESLLTAHDRAGDFLDRGCPPASPATVA